EPCMMPACPISTHNASIAGHRSGSAVSFVKRYEPPGYGYNTVSYEGTVNAEATEIDGRWKLPGASGTFLMVRATRPAEVVTAEEQAKESTQSGEMKLDWAGTANSSAILPWRGRIAAHEMSGEVG